MKLIKRGYEAFCRTPYRFLIAAAVLALILCLLPVRVDAPEEPKTLAAQENAPGIQLTAAPEASPEGVPAGADLSERTQAGCLLHRTLYYAPCGHSVQRRESLPAALVGLSREALESEIDDVLPGAKITGFSATEVDVTMQMDIPCPLHWVLQAGEDGYLQVMQNLSGEALESVRRTDLAVSLLPQEEQDQLRGGRVFDTVQELEGYLENLSS